MIMDKFLMYRWAQHRNETYFLFSDKVKIRSKFQALEISFHLYFVLIMTRDQLSFWAKSCKNTINLAIRTKQHNKKYYLMQFTVYKQKLGLTIVK